MTPLSVSSDTHCFDIVATSALSKGSGLAAAGAGVGLGFAFGAGVCCAPASVVNIKMNIAVLNIQSILRQENLMSKAEERGQAALPGRAGLAATQRYTYIE